MTVRRGGRTGLWRGNGCLRRRDLPGCVNSEHGTHEALAGIPSTDGSQDELEDEKSSANPLGLRARVSHVQTEWRDDDQRQRQYSHVAVHQKILLSVRDLRNRLDLLV